MLMMKMKTIRLRKIGQSRLFDDTRMDFIQALSECIFAEKKKNK